MSVRLSGGGEGGVEGSKWGGGVQGGVQVGGWVGGRPRLEAAGGSEQKVGEGWGEAGSGEGASVRREESCEMQQRRPTMVTTIQTGRVPNPQRPPRRNLHKTGAMNGILDGLKSGNRSQRELHIAAGEHAKTYMNRSSDVCISDSQVF